MKTKGVNDQDKFTQEYNEIIGKSNNTTIVSTEWEKSGDFFEKFSLYENYTPVETSGNTVLISE